MQRKSFWLRREAPQYPMLRGFVKTDVAVVGGGFSGLLCALWLRRAGLETVLVEAECLGGCASAHCAGIVSLTNGLLYHRLVTRGAGAAEHYTQTQKSAVRAIQTLMQEGGLGWRETTLRMRGDDRGALEKEADAMKRVGILMTMKRINGVECIELPQMGVVQPVDYLHLLAHMAVRAGVKIYEHSRVVSLETNEIHTERGTVQAPYLVIATGYPIVNVPGWYFLKIQQRVSMLVPLVGETTFDGVWMDVSGRYAVRPLARGALMQYNGGVVGTRDHRTESRRDIQKLADDFGMLTNDVECYTGLECYTPDGLPYIGPYGGKTPNLFVASGYGGKGLIGSMMAAQAISAHILGIPSEGYDIYSGQRSLTSLCAPLTMGTRYAKEFLIHPMAPRCPHMGCGLIYHSESRIWECPCHGSRFDDIGHVLNAPAVHDALLQNRKTEK